MKRHIVLVLLVPILALTLISCDGSVSSGFAKFLGNFGGNVYSGVVTPDYSGVDDADGLIANLKDTDHTVDVDGKAKVTTFGSIEVEIDVGTGGTFTTLASQTADDQAELKSVINKATNTDDKKEKFTNDQKKTASSEQQQAANGTMQVINATIDNYKNGSEPNELVVEILDSFVLPDLDVADVGELTQADVLVLQLMTDLISNVLDAVDTTTGKLKDGADQDSLLADALFAVEITELLSGASSVDFSSNISFASLIPNFTSKGSRSTVDIDDEDGVLHSLRGLFPDIISLMGIKRSGSAYTLSPATYKQFIINQRSYRASWEQVAWIAGETSMKGKTKFSEDTLIKYALSVLMTENHEFLKSHSEEGNSIITSFLTANPRFGDAPNDSNKIKSFNADGVENLYSETNIDNFLESMGMKKFKRIITTAKAINDNIDAKYRVEMIVTELDKILGKLNDPTTTDDNWVGKIFGDDAKDGK